MLWLWEDCFREGGISTAAAALAWTVARARRDRPASGAAAQRCADRDGAGHPGAALPGPARDRHRPRGAGVDGSGGRAGSVAVDAAPRIHGGFEETARGRAGDDQRTLCEPGRGPSRLAAAGGAAGPGRGDGAEDDGAVRRGGRRHDPDRGHPDRRRPAGPRPARRRPAPSPATGSSRRCRRRPGRARRSGSTPTCATRATSPARTSRWPATRRPWRRPCAGGARPGPTRWCCSRPRRSPIWWPSCISPAIRSARCSAELAGLGQRRPWLPSRRRPPCAGPGGRPDRGTHRLDLAGDGVRVRARAGSPAACRPDRRRPSVAAATLALQVGEVGLGLRGVLAGLLRGGDGLRRACRPLSAIR